MKIPKSNPTRRMVLGAGLAAPSVALGGLSLLKPGPARAQDDTPAALTFDIYERPFGERTIITILDGSFGLEQAMVTNLSSDAWEEALRRSYLDPGGPVPLGITVHLIRDGDRLTLIDAGAGSAFGPASGRVLPALAAAGIAPSTIGEILLTHMHPDHIGGLLTDGAAAFPNAAIRVSATDLGLWTDEAVASRAPENARTFYALARNVADIYADRIETFDAETDLGRGIRSVVLPGHTPGHSGFRLDEGDASLLIWGDAAAVAAYQFTHPEAGISFDADGVQAAETRRTLFDMAAADRLAVAGTHLPFPGFGHVERNGDAFAWVPEAWSYG